jgi:hypothetical protein
MDFAILWESIAMKRFLLTTFFAIISLACAASFNFAQAQQTAAPVSASASTANIDQIIRAFTAKETEFRQALDQYAFTRDAVIQTIGLGSQITGEYHRTSSFIFDDRGNRYEKINFFPMSTLTEISVTNEDLEDLGGIQPFALEASKIDKYNFTYVGKEKIDELNTYVFDVAPKVMPSPKRPEDRLFQGRIWVDDQDLQIVKVRGKGVPEGKQRFPLFETYRQQVDGKYWFPVYTYADDNLVFDNGQVSHVRMVVRYTDYRRFGSKVKITDVGEEAPDEPQQKPAPAPPASKKP